MPRNLWLRLAFQAAVTAAFLALALRVVDLEALGDALRGVEPWWIVPALPLFTLAKFVDAYRWRYLLRGVGRPPQGALFGAFLIGNMVNNLLPLRAGDLAKIQVLANRYGMSRAGVAGSVFVVEATLDAVVFVVLLGFGVAFLDLDDVPGVTQAVVAGFAAAAVAVFALAVTLRHHASRLPLPARLRGVLDDLREGLDALGTPSRAVGAIALSLPAWLLEAGMFALMGQAFGLDVPLPAYLAAMVAANLAVAVPLGLWNIGPYEALVSAVMTIAGAPADLALSYALATHLLVNAWINVTGLVAFWALGVSPRELLRLGSRRDEAHHGAAAEPAREGYRP